MTIYNYGVKVNHLTIYNYEGKVNHHKFHQIQKKIPNNFFAKLFVLSDGLKIFNFRASDT